MLPALPTGDEAIAKVFYERKTAQTASELMVRIVGLEPTLLRTGP